MIVSLSRHKRPPCLGLECGKESLNAADSTSNAENKAGTRLMIRLLWRRSAFCLPIEIGLVFGHVDVVEGVLSEPSVEGESILVRPFSDRWQRYSLEESTRNTDEPRSTCLQSIGQLSNSSFLLTLLIIA